MRDATVVNTQSAVQAQPHRPFRVSPVLEGAAGDALRLITRHATNGTDALSGALVDLDRFRLINELHGSADTVGRYGGDEFIVVPPDTGKGSARALAERRRSLISGANVTGDREPLDASIGVAQWRVGTTAAELVSAADDAPRAAKLAGDGIVVAEGDVAAGAGRGVAKVAR